MGTAPEMGGGQFDGGTDVKWSGTSAASVNGDVHVHFTSDLNNQLKLPVMATVMFAIELEVRCILYIFNKKKMGAADRRFGKRPQAFTSYSNCNILKRGWMH